MSSSALATTTARFGTHGRVLIVDLGTRQSRVESIDESVYRASSAAMASARG